MCLIAILEPFMHLPYDTFADEPAIRYVTDISTDKLGKQATLNT
jgi:hypothetical protein